MQKLKLFSMLFMACVVFSSCKTGGNENSKISLEELEKRASDFILKVGIEVDEEQERGGDFGYPSEGFLYNGKQYENIVAMFIDKDRHCIYYQDSSDNFAFCKYDLLKEQETLRFNSKREPNAIVCKNRKGLLYMGHYSATLLDDNIHIVLEGENRPNSDSDHNCWNVVLFNTVDSTYQYITTDGNVNSKSSSPLKINHYGYFEDDVSEGDLMNAYSVVNFYDLEGNVIGNDGYVYDAWGNILGGLELLNANYRAKYQEEQEKKWHEEQVKSYIEELKKRAIPIDKIADDFRNEAKATNTYIGKKIEIKCWIEELKINENFSYRDYKYVLKTSSYRIGDSHDYFTFIGYTNNEEFVEKLSYPAGAIIQGICKSKSGSISAYTGTLIFTDCELLVW